MEIKCQIPLKCVSAKVLPTFQVEVLILLFSYRLCEFIPSIFPCILLNLVYYFKLDLVWRAPSHSKVLMYFKLLLLLIFSVY